MPGKSGTERWKELLGVSGPSIRWGHVAAFVFAYTFAALSSNLFESAVWQLPHSVNLYWRSLRPALIELSIAMPLLALCIVAGFRFLRPWAALVFTPLAYAALALGVDLLMISIPIIKLGLWPFSACIHYFHCLFFLLGIVLALRWIKPAGVAIALGRWLASFTRLVTLPLGTWLLLPAISPVRGYHFELRHQALLSFGELAGSVLWVGLFWAGIEVARAVPGRVSKRFYLVSIMGAMQLMAAALMLLYLKGVPDRDVLIAVIVITSLVVGIYMSVVNLVWLYKMWAAIEDGYARTTPGQAVGLLFVPIFNFYWVFQAYWGFAKDYNQYLDRHALNNQKLPAGVFLAFAILSLLAFICGIPGVGYLLIAAQSIVAAVMIARGCDAVNALPAGLPSSAYRGPLGLAS